MTLSLNAISPCNFRMESNIIDFRKSFLTYFDTYNLRNFVLSVLKSLKLVSNVINKIIKIWYSYFLR